MNWEFRIWSSAVTKKRRKHFVTAELHILNSQFIPSDCEVRIKRECLRQQLYCLFMIVCSRSHKRPRMQLLRGWRNVGDRSVQCMSVVDGSGLRTKLNANCDRL